MALYGAALIVGAVVCGIMSDRSGRRRSYVVGSAAVMAVAALLLVIWPTWLSALFAAPLLGVGFGTYWAVALAILTQVLPAASTAPRTWEWSTSPTRCPRSSRPPSPASLLALTHSYPALFTLAAIATVAGGMMVTRIKSVS